MTNKELFTLLCSRLGNRHASSTRLTVVLELNKKIEEMERRATLPWFLETEWDSTTTPQAVMVAQQDWLELPSNFLQEMEEGVLEIQGHPDPKWYALKTKVSFEKLRSCTSNLAPGAPQAYALRGTRIYFGPTPDVTYVFRLPYLKKSGDVVDNDQQISNPWLVNFFNLVSYEVVDIMARTHIKDAALATRIEKPLREARDAYEKAVEARRMANESPILDDEEN